MNDDKNKAIALLQNVLAELIYMNETLHIELSSQVSKVGEALDLLLEEE